MALTDAQLKALLVDEVGDTDTSLLAANIDLIWAMYEDKADSGTRIRYLYAKLKSIDLLLGYYRKYVNSSTDGNSASLNQAYTNLLAMKKETQSELWDQTKQLALAGSGASGLLDTRPRW